MIWGGLFNGGFSFINFAGSDMSVVRDFRPPPFVIVFGVWFRDFRLYFLLPGFEACVHEGQTTAFALSQILLFAWIFVQVEK